MRNTKRMIDARMKLLGIDRVLYCSTRTLIRSLPIDETFFDTTTKEKDTSRSREVAMHSIMLRPIDPRRNVDLVFHPFLGLTFHHHVPAELTGHHNESPIEKLAFLKIENQLSDWSINHLL